ncbi:protoporphyrinogen oxidase [bacterium]|nr:protoporphyrinogen oxidase [bacterium]
MPDARATGTARVAVIGGGVAGLATALHILDGARDRGLDLGVTVFEAGAEPGGNLRTTDRDGWRLEWGPNGFLDNEPATLRLVDRLGLGDELLRSSDAARRRFLLLRGRLCEIPASPPAFLRSRLFGWGAKLRILGELFVPPRRDLGRADVAPSTDETVYDFGRRRLGRAFAETMLDPMVKGVFGGDARELSLAAAFPRMVELERDHGGLFKALFKLSRRKGGRADAGPGGTLHSFRGGMAALPAALAAALQDDTRADLRREAPVASVALRDGVWSVYVDGTEHGPFAVVVDAAPAHAAAGQLRGLDAALGDELAAIPYVPMAVIALGFARADVAHDLDGFGMLIPTSERRRLLGALWTSSVFADRAPAGRVLIRAMAGGPRDRDVLESSDDELRDAALAELRGLFGLRGAPELAAVFRHERAIAQYVPGHLARLRAIESRLAACPGLLLTGSSYRGISVNACAKDAEKTAARALASLERPEGGR